MATIPVEPTVTPLRQRMLDDMAMRAMDARTQHDYTAEDDEMMIKLRFGAHRAGITALFARAGGNNSIGRERPSSSRYLALALSQNQRP